MNPRTSVCKARRASNWVHFNVSVSQVNAPISPPPSPPPPPPPPPLHQTLESFYWATGGPGWLRSDGWLTEPDECQWFGLRCEGGKVTALSLPANRLTGTIPAEVGSLGKVRTRQYNNRAHHNNTARRHRHADRMRTCPSRLFHLLSHRPRVTPSAGHDVSRAECQPGDLGDDPIVVLGHA